MTSFLPTRYQDLKPVSSGGSYLKLSDGTNKIRVLSDAICFYQYWSNQNKPVRTEQHPGNPTDIRINDDGKPDRVKFALAMKVWDYAQSKVCIWEITQATIIDQVENLDASEDWGNPKQFDLTVNRTGKGLDTKYAVMPSPKKPLSKEVKDADAATPVNLQALLFGSNPFESNGAATEDPFDLPASHPDWDTFCNMLKGASNHEELEEAESWVKAKRRKDKLVDFFGGDEGTFNNKVAAIIQASKDIVPF